MQIILYQELNLGFKNWDFETKKRACIVSVGLNNKYF